MQQPSLDFHPPRWQTPTPHGTTNADSSEEFRNRHRLGKCNSGIDCSIGLQANSPANLAQQLLSTSANHVRKPIEKDRNLMDLAQETCDLSTSETLADRVRHFLWMRPALRRVRVENREDTVVLRGRVQSFYLKQLCLTCSSHVPGVRRIVDEIDVEFPRNEPRGRLTAAPLAAY
jgi:hypothetical protein